MSTARLFLNCIAMSSIVMTILASAPARAARHDFLLSCDNGRSYPIRADAVSDQGDLVTGHIAIGPGRWTHIRLIPMGFGYRYAAPGLWLDGVRGDAELNFGKHPSTACTIARG
jgi:hypothetical protein